MQLNIAAEQNSPDSLKLLAAQRHLYSKAKKLYRYRIVFSTLLFVIAPFVLYFIPSFKSTLSIISGLWVIVNLPILAVFEETIKKQAAKIQEQFDTSLFRLPWNDMLVGNKLTPELINAAAINFTGDRNELNDWYPDTGSVPYPLNVMLCQRANLVWDWRLHHSFGWIVYTIATIIFIFTVGFALLTKQNLSGYILGLFLPSLPALLQGISIGRAHLETAREKQEKENNFTAMWESGLTKPNSVSQDQCRRIQDFIYLLRSKGPLVPDRWYWWLRYRYEIDMRSVVSEMRKKAKQALDM